MGYFRFFLICLLAAQIFAPTPTSPVPTVYFFKPPQIFDGESDQLRTGWVVLVLGGKIEGIGAASEVKAPADAKTIDLSGTTLMPGLIEAHSHVLLHPYNETTW